MDVTAVATLISAAALTDEAACRAELAAIKVVRGLLDARELDIVRRLDELAATDAGLFPQEIVATTTNTSLAAADRLRDRANTCSAIPELGTALSTGATTGGHVDVVTRATNGLPAPQRARIAGHGQQLALAASTQTTTTFRKTVEGVVRRVRADDGPTRLARQRRMARLRWWHDGDGMWNLAGRLDPATGARLEGQLRNEINRIRTGGIPDTAPTDPLERHQHLAAHALTNLLGLTNTGSAAAAGRSANAGSGPDAGGGAASTTSTGPAGGSDADIDSGASTGGGSGSSNGCCPTGDSGADSRSGASTGGGGPGTGATRSPNGTAPAGFTPPVGSGVPDITVLIDVQTLLTGHTHDGTILDINLNPYGLPIETIRRWACTGTITPVITAEDGTRLLLGRETRLANRAQRRALRVLHRTCALCDTPFHHCQIHHIHWYTLDGPTDIENLLPLCDQHHHLFHEGGWTLHLAPDRTLTITKPDGTTTIHAPPQAPAA